MVFFLTLLIAGIALVAIGAAVDGMLYLTSIGVLLLIAICSTWRPDPSGAPPGARPADRFPNAQDQSGPDRPTVSTSSSPSVDQELLTPEFAKSLQRLLSRLGPPGMNLIMDISSPPQLSPSRREHDRREHDRREIDRREIDGIARAGGTEMWRQVATP